MRPDAKGHLQLGRKKISYEIKDGVIRVDGMLAHEFLENCTTEEMEALAKIGKIALADERRYEIDGTIPPKGKYQYHAIF
jgi:hypothetical protein